ncbi:hypothetical protein [Oceanobacillus jordanicus]|uniref:hypothetical protein n=1 Tax=Oceanobacillus jordanicus TaxID=2867266 RepID=UPI001EDE32DA|nr:hypothetical protein [Oceanobacillus jordanicus]
MVHIILTIILIIALIFSVYIVIQKRKKFGITGIKSAIPSICFFLIAITHLSAYWFHFAGILSWSMTIVLLMIGAYFIRYMPEFVKSST